jgi:uncharacterized membrane protein YhaH (DUF805 family)/cold shock CspA family protein
MRGEVLHYDEAHGFGFITGEDGNRYTFRREDLKSSFPLSRGVAVEFRESGDRAQDVSPPMAAMQAFTAAAAEATAPASLTATPIATPAARPAPQRYGRNAVGDGAADQNQTSTGLWNYFRASITTNYANFHGRARRKEYWGFALFYTLGMIFLTVAGLAIDAEVGNFDYGSEAPVATIVIVVLALLASLVPGIAISVRRFHDIGLSGWFYLVMFVVGFLLAGSVMILAIVLGLIPTQKHENKWGPVPDGVDVPQGG